jgi:hypothetical protein
MLIAGTLAAEGRSDRLARGQSGACFRRRSVIPRVRPGRDARRTGAGARASPRAGEVKQRAGMAENGEERPRGGPVGNKQRRKNPRADASRKGRGARKRSDGRASRRTKRPGQTPGRDGPSLGLKTCLGLKTRRRRSARRRLGAGGAAPPSARSQAPPSAPRGPCRYRRSSAPRAAASAPGSRSTPTTPAYPRANATRAGRAQTPPSRRRALIGPCRGTP